MSFCCSTSGLRGKKGAADQPVMTARSQPRVSIVILNWNNPDDTLACLHSVQALSYSNAFAVVVDNGSTDDSLDRIRRTFPHVTLIANDQNLGYAGGNNVGIRHALAQDPKYIFVLNNDTVLAPDTLTHLVREAEDEPNVGIVGPKMYFSDPPDMIFAAGSMVLWARGNLNQRGIWQRERETGPQYAQAAEDVDFIAGCGVLFRRQVFERIGLLDSRFFLNYEDVDICIRARRAGFRVRYTPHAVLYHKVSGSLGQASARNTYYMTRNALLFFWTHLSGWRRWQAVARIVVRNLGHIAVWTIKPAYRHTARSKRDANLLALRDALLRRFGKAGHDLEAICQRT